MKLIICEKPSLAKAVATALANCKYEEGVFRNNEYIITSAFGHLYELKDIKDYENKETKWEEIRLPYIPLNFEYKAKESTIERINLIKKLSHEVDSIVNCGDSDREGQVIVDNIIKEIGFTKKVYRLWLPEQTNQSIISGLNNLKDNEDYLNLSNEGYCRTFIDWLYGINLTVLLTNKSGVLMNVGRVLTPVVKYVSDRDKEIKMFKKSKYFMLEHLISRDNIELKISLDEKFENYEELKNIKNSINNKSIKVVNIEEKITVKKAKKLFSKDTLQKYLSEKTKLSLETIKESIQSLYEKGYITYPRTSTEYLGDDEKGKVRDILTSINNIDLEFKDTKSIFDSTKVESHSAIIPTKEKPSFSNENEKTVYETIYNRFISNFCKEECLINENIVILEIPGTDYQFKKIGKSIRQKGFLKYENQKIDNVLPLLTLNETFNCDFKEVEKETTPPKKVTMVEMLSFLANPYKKDLDNDTEYYQELKKGVEIGTVATRDEIILKAITVGYIKLDGKSLCILDKGTNLIEILEKLSINIDTNTSIYFQTLIKSVYNNERSIDEVIAEIKEYLDVVVKNANKIEIEKQERKPIEGICKCPICDGQILENSKSYYCSNYKDCKVSLWKNNRLLESQKIKITKTFIKSLFTRGKVRAKAISNKTGKPYEANVVLTKTTNSIDISLKF